SRSQMRPPQPVVGVLVGGEDCQYAAWSACEYSCGGKLGLTSLCCTGPTSVPTLPMIASGLLAWLNSAAISGICACSAYWMLSADVAPGSLSGCSRERPRSPVDENASD